MAGPVSPAVQLRLHLAEARSQGLDFDVAWQQSLRMVRWPHDTAHRTEWKKILGDGKEFETPDFTLSAWGAAYSRETATAKVATLSVIAA